MSASTVAPTSNQPQQQQTNQQGLQQSTGSSSSTKVGGTDGGSSSAAGQAVPKSIELDKIYQWINELCMPATRENALIELR